MPKNKTVVGGDVSLASAAKDLGFDDGRNLTDILERFPVEEPLDEEFAPDEDNLLSKYNFIFQFINFWIKFEVEWIKMIPMKYQRELV